VHRQEAAAFKQGMDLPQLGATHDRRLELRASRGSCQREGSELRPREHRRREQDPRPEGDRGRPALNSADVLATGMRDQSRLIVRADSSIAARC
jgi:hypothetical protein